MNNIPVKRLERRLRPDFGVGDFEKETDEHDGFSDYSSAGFIGMDENLVEIIEQDSKVVEGHNLTHKQIAEALEKAIKTKTLPNPKFKIETKLITMGIQDCPWECKGEYMGGSSVILIYNPKKVNAKQLEKDMILFVKREYRGVMLNKNIAVVTELHPHLIVSHYFFEGKKSFYRADPEILIDALGLK